MKYSAVILGLGLVKSILLHSNHFYPCVVHVHIIQAIKHNVYEFYYVMNNNLDWFKIKQETQIRYTTYRVQTTQTSCDGNFCKHSGFLDVVPKQDRLQEVWLQKKLLSTLLPFFSKSSHVLGGKQKMVIFRKTSCQCCLSSQKPQILA